MFINALKISLFGIVIVFVVLAVLVCAILIIGKLMSTTKSKKSEKPAPKAEPVKAPVIVDEGITEEEIAAVVAVIEVITGKAQNKFVLRSVRRSTVWK